MSAVSILQLIPPTMVAIILLIACYFFYSRYVVPARSLCSNLEKIGTTIRSMSDGDESMRKSGVARVFQDSPFDPLWREFAKTLHTQTSYVQGQLKRTKCRITVPASHFFSVSSVVDRQLSVEYFKHLPGILTGIGIIGTFAGLLFGLSNFDATNTETISKSISVLLAGVRDAFYASAAAITAAMVITHWEKMLYGRCITALDHLVDCLNGLFEGAVGEEYLATLVEHSTTTSNQARLMKDELIQAMVPVVRQLESIQTQQITGLTQALENSLNESNRKLASQIETALLRQIRTPLEEMVSKLNERSPSAGNAHDMAVKVIRARQNDIHLPNVSEA
ncbi:hypothetical protein [Limnobacter sp.]|uniref:hypothetical protein n=1 Tax=Limnobacter sp. TaxID=2003368 RepID=UPI0035121CFF